MDETVPVLHVNRGRQISQRCGPLFDEASKETGHFGGHSLLLIIHRISRISFSLTVELKNQWGWGGFTTQDLARCRLSALARRTTHGGTQHLTITSQHAQAIKPQSMLAAIHVLIEVYWKNPRPLLKGSLLENYHSFPSRRQAFARSSL